MRKSLKRVISIALAVCLLTAIGGVALACSSGTNLGGADIVAGHDIAQKLATAYTVRTNGTGSMYVEATYTYRNISTGARTSQSKNTTNSQYAVVTFSPPTNCDSYSIWSYHTASANGQNWSWSAGTCYY